MLVFGVPWFLRVWARIFGVAWVFISQEKLAKMVKYSSGYKQSLMRW